MASLISDKLEKILEDDERALKLYSSIIDKKDTNMKYKIGDKVMKCTGDYHLEGEVRAVFTTTAGKERFVVEHKPGFLHIYSEANIRLLKGE